MLDRLGLDYQVLDDGCRGLAGSFGYEHGERHEVSIEAGERMLLPKVRDALRISVCGAQVVQMALREGPNGPAIARPEARYARPPR